MLSSYRLSGIVMLIYCTATPMLMASSTEPWETLPTDKAAHFGLSSVATEAAMKSCQAYAQTPEISPWCRGFGSALALSAGILKEALDKKRGHGFDQQDLVADALGVLTGNLLQWNF